MAKASENVALNEPSTMYKLHCEKEFVQLHESVGHIDTELVGIQVGFADLNQYVRNGLSHRLNSVTALLSGLALLLAGAIVLNLIQMSTG